MNLPSWTKQDLLERIERICIKFDEETTHRYVCAEEVFKYIKDHWEDIK